MSVMRAIPDVCCFTPGDPAETEAVTRAMLRTPDTCYLRLGRGNEPKVHVSEVKNWERAEHEDVVSCIECGSCQFTCPAHRPLLDNIRQGKSTVMGIIRNRNAKK
mgnify:CR=1 FL=1